MTSPLKRLRSLVSKRKPAKTKPAVPATLDEAVDLMVSWMSPADKAAFAAQPANAIRFPHFTSGMAMRNDWGLWFGKTGISRWLRDHGVFHGDDQSQTVYHALWHRLNNRPFDIEAQARYYADWWKAAYGTLWDGTPIPGYERRANDKGHLMTVHVHPDGSLTYPDRPLIPTR